MDLTLLIHLIFLCLLNIVFFFPGVALNAFVIITISKSTKLRKKLCHFMIMVLSCCDLLSVVAYSSGFILSLTIRLTENNDLYTKAKIYVPVIELCGRLSMLTVMVMSIERYFGAYYPIFHKTSFTRRRLLTLFAILIILPNALLIISTNDLVISHPVAVAIFMVIFIPPFLFFNYKLFTIARKVGRKNATSPEKRSLKNINTCLLAVACLVFWSIPNSIYVVFSIVEGSTSDNARLSFLWVITTCVMNCSFNCLIFFWKNHVLHSEGINMIKKIKGRVLGSNMDKTSL